MIFSDRLNSKLFKRSIVFIYSNLYLSTI